jgi:hypothetical protein
MTTHQRFIFATVLEGANPISGFNLQKIPRLQIAQIYASLDLRLDNAPVDFVAKMRANLEKQR